MVELSRHESTLESINVIKKRKKRKKRKKKVAPAQQQ
jgi:hypothetical protein